MLLPVNLFNFTLSHQCLDSPFELQPNNQKKCARFYLYCNFLSKFYLETLRKCGRHREMSYKKPEKLKNFGRFWPEKLAILTLFLGHFWPQQPKAVWHIRSFMTGVTKIHDFVYFSMCLVPLELFLKKKLWNFKKLKKKIYRFDTKGSPLWKKNRKN